jgi:ArsR family transcriptional regulator
MASLDVKKIEEAVRILKALAHPVRMLIMQILIQGKCNVKNLEKVTGNSQSGVSQHLRILRLSGIIEPQRIGKEICYNVVDEKALEIVQSLLS